MINTFKKFDIFFYFNFYNDICIFIKIYYFFIKNIDKKKSKIFGLFLKKLKYIQPTNFIILQFEN
jgi:hypothetical protein